MFRIFLAIAIGFQLTFFLTPMIPELYLNSGWYGAETQRVVMRGLTASLFDVLPEALVIPFFALTYGLLMMFAAGFRTRWTGVLLWCCMWNIWQRGALITGTESSFGMVLLSAACLLPVNAAATFPRFRQNYTYSHRNFLLACALLLIQIAWIYMVTGFSKNDPAWWNGTALHRAFTTDPLNAYAFWRGRDLMWTAPLSYLTPVLEVMVGAVILLYPSRRVRIIVAALLLMLHSGIVIFLNLWHFYFYALAIVALFVPWDVWFRSVPLSFDRIVDERRRPRRGITGLLVSAIIVLCFLNVRQISDDSWISPLLKKAKVRRLAHMIPVPVLDSASPMTQPWSLYGTFPEYFGCLVFEGKTEDGVLRNLLTGRPVDTLNCCPYDHLGQKELLELQRIPYFFASFEVVRPMLEVLARRAETCYGPLTDGVQVRFYYLRDGIPEHREVLVCNDGACTEP